MQVWWENCQRLWKTTKFAHSKKNMPIDNLFFIYWTAKRIKGGCDFGVLLYLFTQLLNVFLQDVFYNVIRKTNGRGKRFYDRELPLPTWRTMVVCPFSLRWWSQLWRSLLLLFFWRLSTPCFLSIDIVITTIKMK